MVPETSSFALCNSISHLFVQNSHRWTHTRPTARGKYLLRAWALITSFKIWEQCNVKKYLFQLFWVGMSNFENPDLSNDVYIHTTHFLFIILSLPTSEFEAQADFQFIEKYQRSLTIIAISFHSWPYYFMHFNHTVIWVH